MLQQAPLTAFVPRKIQVAPIASHPQIGYNSSKKRHKEVYKVHKDGLSIYNDVSLGGHRLQPFTQKRGTYGDQ